MDRGDFLKVEKKDKRKMAALFIGMLILFALCIGGQKIQGQTKQASKTAEKKQTEKKEEEKTEFKKPGTIRVLIKNQDYQDIYHKELNVCSDKEMYVSQGGNVKAIATGQAFTLQFSEEENKKEEPVSVEGGRLTVKSLQRSQGNPSYAGKLEIFRTSQGFVLVNEVDFETYLKGVLPSEMPAKYEKDALKAQAVCARTYAYMKYSSGYAYPEYKAHLDDSVQFQVYQNQAEADSTSQAVLETEDEILVNGDAVAATYYFSTSWGWTTGMDAWLREPVSYLTTVGVGENLPAESDFDTMLASPSGVYYEAEEPWYRWNVSVDIKEGASELLQNILDCQKSNPEEVKVCKAGEENFTKGKILSDQSFTNVEIGRRGAGGIVCSIIFTGKEQKIQIEGQHNIRKALALKKNQIVRQDGSKIESFQLLPSSFFTLKCTEADGAVATLEITGGGFGHGVGLSQNGANQMAKRGKYYQDILFFFYKDTRLIDLK